MKFLTLTLFSVAILVACGAKETKSGATRPSTTMSDEDLAADLEGAEDGDEDPENGDPDISGLDGGDGSGDTAGDNPQVGGGSGHENGKPNTEDEAEEALRKALEEEKGPTFDNLKPLEDNSIFKKIKSDGHVYTGVMERMIFTKITSDVLSKEQILELSKTHSLDSGIITEGKSISLFFTATFNNQNSEFQLKIKFDGNKAAPYLIKFSNESTQENMIFKEENVFMKKPQGLRWYECFLPSNWGTPDPTYSEEDGDYDRVPLTGVPFANNRKSKPEKGFMLAEYEQEIGDMNIILRYPPEGNTENIEVLSIHIGEFLPDATGGEKKLVSNPQQKKVDTTSTKKQLPGVQPAGSSSKDKRQEKGKKTQKKK